MATKISDDEFLYAYLIDYLDDNLEGEHKKKIEELINRQPENFLQDFLRAKGRLQLEMQDFELSPEQGEYLRAIAEPVEERVQAELRDISKVSQRETVGKALRTTALLAIFIAIAYLINTFFAPNRQPEFEAISYLGYEALAIEGAPDSRITFPSQDLAEIGQFLSTDKTAGFQISPLQSLGDNWTPLGASLIDYEVTKVAMIAFSHASTKEHLFYFSYPDRLENIGQKGQAGRLDGNFEYYVFATDKMNIVVWQQTKELLGFMIGHRSAEELAELARLGTKS